MICKFLGWLRIRFPFFAHVPCNPVMESWLRSTWPSSPDCGAVPPHLGRANSATSFESLWPNPVGGADLVDVLQKWDFFSWALPLVVEEYHSSTDLPLGLLANGLQCDASALHQPKASIFRFQALGKVYRSLGCAMVRPKQEGFFLNATS